MAKSIWKPGERMTRLEKKRLWAQMPHPNRGRRLYVWRVENKRITDTLSCLTGRKVDWTDIKDVPELFEPAASNSINGEIK